MHTKEPWKVSGTGTIRYIDASVGNGIAQEVATCMAVEYGEMEDNARRIVACVNACAGIDTEVLEVTHGLDEIYNDIIKQRDDLLAALKEIVECLDAQITGKGGFAVEEVLGGAMLAIAKAEGLQE